MDDELELYRDTLKELCNMGSGSAAARLSKMLNRVVTVEVPEAYVTNAQINIDSIISEKGTMVVFEVEFVADENELGKIYLFFDSSSVNGIISSLLDSSSEDWNDEMLESMISEVGNVVAASLITPIANYIEKRTIVSPPKITVETPKAVIESALSVQLEETGCYLFAHAHIRADGTAISLRLFLFPYFDLVKEVWKRAKL